jgi:hypothetical protein
MSAFDPKRTFHKCPSWPKPSSLAAAQSLEPPSTATVWPVIQRASKDEARRIAANRKAARTTAKAVISVDLVIRLTQRSFLYLAAVYVLDPNLRPLAPALIRFENGVAEIIGKYLGDVFFALNFYFPNRMRSSLVRVFTFVSCDSRVRTESACHRI